MRATTIDYVDNEGVEDVDEAEQEVEDDAEDVEGDQGDEDLPEDRLQVHVATVQDQDG